MKLNDLSVFAFGNLRNEKIEFNDKINTVYKENGWGKSTLASFIKCIFYGLKDSKYAVEENERKKFRPWNYTEKFGGSITFEKDGKEYEVTRLFGSKSSQDEFSLCEILTGKIISTDGEKFGEKFFGVDENGFFSTVYHSQKDFEISDGSMLIDKINDDKFDIEKAIERVENKAKIYKAERGEKGVISDLKNQLFDVGEKIVALETVSSEITSLKKREIELENQLNYSKNKVDELSEKVIVLAREDAVKLKRNQHAEYLEEKQSLHSDIKTIDKALNGQEISATEVQEYIKYAKELINVKARLNDNLTKNQNAVKSNANVCVILWIFAALFAIAGVVGVFANIILAVCGFTLCVIFGVVALVFIKKSKPKAEINQNSDRIYYQEYVNKLNAFLFGFNFTLSGDYISDLLLVNSLVDKKRQLLQRLNVLNQKISQLHNEISVMPLPLNENVEDIKIAFSSAQKEYSLFQEQMQTIKAKIGVLAEKECALPDLYVKKDEISEKLEKAKDEYNLLKLTAEYLKRANENIKIKYRAPLEERLNYYIKAISGKNYATAKIDVDLNVTLSFLGAERDKGYFSEGICNIIEICKRFALSDVIFDGQSPFVIMDDPFCNLDEEKLNEAKDVVKLLAKDRQIIYFTCHESRVI